MTNDEIKRLFDTIFDRCMGHEGGYVNNPVDPGGETKWGIAKRWHQNVDIKNLTREQAKEIYRVEFWGPLVKQGFQAKEKTEALLYQLFDFAINSPIVVAVQKLQLAVGVADDGHWGPVSAAALAATDHNDVLMRLLAYRLKFMTSLNTWPTFGRGWANRIAGNLLHAAQDN